MVDDFDITIKNFNNFFDEWKTHCIGCTHLIYEGPRAYEATYPVNKKGICTKCKKPAMGWLSEDERKIKDIIE